MLLPVGRDAYISYSIGWEVSLVNRNTIAHGGIVGPAVWEVVFDRWKLQAGTVVRIMFGCSFSEFDGSLAVLVSPVRCSLFGVRRSESSYSIVLLFDWSRTSRT